MSVNLVGTTITTRYLIRDIVSVHFLTKSQLREAGIVQGNELEDYEDDNMFIHIIFTTTDEAGEPETATFLARDKEITYCND